MQWTPFDVEVMEHRQRIERANQTGPMLDQVTTAVTERPQAAVASRVDIFAMLAQSMTAIVRR